MNLFDITLVLLIALFAGLGAWRGFVRELVSFLTWVSACVLAWFFAGDVASLFKNFTQEQALRQMLAFVIIFIVVFVIGIIIGLVLHRFVNRSSGMRQVNRLMGGTLGLARGIVVAIVLFLLAGLTSFPQRSWWRDAALAPVFERVAIFATQYLPADIARHVRYG